MKILKQRINYKDKNGLLEIIPENEDDIYNLYNIIEQTDIIRAKTQRKVLLSNGTQQKMTLNLEIITESMTVDLESSFLFVKGKILNENEHIRKGSYHTIEITLNQKLTIYKNEWTELNIQSIKKIQNQDEMVLFIYITQKKFVFSEVTANFTKVKCRKDYKNKNFKNILDYMTKNLKLTYKLIIIASNNEIRNDFEKIFKITYKNYADRICNIKTENSNNDINKIVDEIFKDFETNKKILELQFVNDIIEFNTFKKNHVNNSLTCVGINEVVEALEYGSIKSVIITNELFKSFDPKIRKQIDELCKSVKNLGGKIFILPIKHKCGEELHELGGIVGNLKFDYKL
ncbi:Translation factor pelota [Conglomerata obtusa]